MKYNRHVHMPLYFHSQFSHILGFNNLIKININMRLQLFRILFESYKFDSRPDSRIISRLINVFLNVSDPPYYKYCQFKISEIPKPTKLLSWVLNEQIDINLSSVTPVSVNIYLVSDSCAIDEYNGDMNFD